jgi:hypothetical protein
MKIIENLTFRRTDLQNGVIETTTIMMKDAVQIEEDK